MKKMVFGSLITTMLVLGMGLVSCSTSVPIKSVRMPTIDTTGIQRLGIKPFENVSGVGGSDAAQLTRYLTDKATTLITNTGKFTVVAPTDPNADGVFTGELTVINSKDTQEVGQRPKKDQDGNTVTENYTVYKRDVGVEFTYSIISTRTDMPVGKVLKKGSQNSASESSSGLANTLALASRIVDSQISGLSKDIVPYIVSENRKLMKETSKDKAVKARTKTALALVKNGNYEEAIKQFDLIASENGSVAAKTNAGIIREAIASDAAANAGLAELFNDKDGAAEKAIKQAVDALNAKLPAGTTISIMKTSDTERNMIEYVVDQLTKIILQEGTIKVVDRSNQALIGSEQQFQASGNVSDESAVSIGKQLGVKYMVLCKISGEKSLRRLNTTVLNIETAQIEFQNDVEI